MSIAVFAPDNRRWTMKFFDDMEDATPYRDELLEDFEDVDVLDIENVHADDAEAVWDALGD
jgi:hypothetical protein